MLACLIFQLYYLSVSAHWSVTDDSQQMHENLDTGGYECCMWQQRMLLLLP